MRRLLAIGLLALALVGCDGGPPPIACQPGQTATRDIIDTTTVLMPILVGKVMVMMPYTTYEYSAWYCR